MTAVITQLALSWEVWVAHLGGQDRVAGGLEDVGGQQMVARVGRPPDTLQQAQPAPRPLPPAPCPPGPGTESVLLAPFLLGPDHPREG